MRFPFLRPVVALAATLALLGGNARAELIYGVTTLGSPLLVSFDSATPGSLTTIGAISGLLAGHTLRGIDFRPSNGLLYALSNSDATRTAAQLYTVDLTTGALTTVGGGLTLTGNTSSVISLDFNPVADALRVVTSSDQSYRVNANTGALIAQDISISSVVTAVGIAYTNNVAGATSTTLYAYDYAADRIGTIGSVGGTPTSPNTGQYFAVGSSGISADQTLGFDISGATGIAYANADIFNSGNPNDNFYTVNLGTGAFSLVGSFGVPILDISVRPALAAAAIPEPGTLALLLVGTLTTGAGWLRRRRA